MKKVFLFALAGAAWLAVCVPAQAEDGGRGERFRQSGNAPVTRRHEDGEGRGHRGDGGGMDRPHERLPLDRMEDRHDLREDRRDDREDVRDGREDMRDRREDRRDEMHHGGPRDRMEDMRDHHEDMRDHREDGRDNREDGRDSREDRREKMRERFNSLPPEQQEKIHERMKEHKAQRDEMRQKLMDLPPEERKAKMEEMRGQFEKGREVGRGERTEKFQERWKNATPEQKEKFCGNVSHKCAEGGGTGYGCKVAQEACGSL